MNIKSIIFAHQPKSAGTNLVHMFRKSYGRANVYNNMDREHLMPPLNLAVRRLWEALRMFNRRRYKVVHGHFPAVKYRRYFPDAFYMTFFRHPVERLASHYFYWLRTPNLAKPHPLAHWLHEKSPDIVEFAQRFHSRDEQLLYVKYFWPDDFDFIGITELYADSLRLLKVSDHRIPHLLCHRPACIAGYSSQADFAHLRHPVIAYSLGAERYSRNYPVITYC